MDENLISIPSYLDETEDTIQMPSFLTDSSNSGVSTMATCTTLYQTCGACQTSTQCGTCQHVCQTLYQTCGACQTSTQCGTCQHTTQCDACQTTSQCDACQTTTQCGTCQVCQLCQGYCEIFCQGTAVTCQTECQTLCETGCLTCQNSCQTSCEINGEGCTTYCESNCQSTCQLGCQDTIELCGSACQFSCESACQFFCQTVCEDSCQTSCMSSSNCQSSTCQSACQICETGCQQCEICESSCQKVCEIACENNCQLTCELTCQGSQIGGGGGTGGASLSISEISFSDGGSFKAIINGLSKPFNSSYYKSASLTKVDNGSTATSLSDVIYSITAPSSNNENYIVITVSNVGYGNFNIYAYCQTNKYYLAGSKAILIPTKPLPWNWSSMVQTAIDNKGEFQTLRTYEWNDFIETIREFAKYKKINGTTITATQQSQNNLIEMGADATINELLMETKSSSAKNILTAKKFNTIRYIIGSMYSTGLKTMSSGEKVMGSYLNALKNSLNSIT